MTSSYYAGLGRAAAGVPDISKTNYMKTEADMVKPVNDEIDRIQRGYDEYYDALVGYYNHEFKKKTPGEQAVATLADFAKIAPQLKADKKAIDKWLEFQKKYNKFYDLRFNEKSRDLSGAIREDWYLQDADVLKYKQVEPYMNEQQAENYAAAKEALRMGDHDNARKLFNGLGDAFKDQIDDDRTAIDLLASHESHYRPKAEAGMKVWVPWLNNGEGKFVVYNEVLHDERSRRYVDRVIDSYFAFRHEDLYRGRLGKFKGEFVRELIERSDKRNKDAHEAQGKALADNETKSRAQDLKQRIRIDPGYIVKAINIYEGQFAINYDDLSKRPGMAAARADLFATLESAVTADPSMAEYVIKALNHRFQARDGHWTTPKELWKKESASLLKTIRTAQGVEATARTDEKEAEEQAWVDTKVNEWNSRKTPGTARERYNLITSWGREFGQTDPQKAPDQLKNLAYQGQELDEDIDYRLKMRAQRGEKIVEADLGGISDPIMLAKWRKAIKDKPGISFELEEQAKGDIDAIIRKRMNLDLDAAQGNPKFRANRFHARKEYIRAFNEAKKAQPGISDEAANAIALKSVDAGVNTQVPGSPGDYIWDRWVGDLDQDLKSDVQNARTQLLGNNNLLLSNTPWEGEEKHLQAAAIYVQTTNAGIAAEIPSYYRMVSNGLRGRFANPELLMRARLQATGLLEGENKITIPEFDNLPEDQAVQLTVKPTTCKTYQTMQNIAASGKDINWMLEIVKDPTAMNEGGYDYVVGPNIDQGKDAHLPKPLTQHTVGEVLELAKSGHSDFGAYGITADGLISIIEANQVPLDVLFDEQTQDLFVLGRLRYKAQRAQGLSTQQDAYRRLVNIRPEDNQRFLEIVGDLPPFLQLSNMIPICSTELVNQTLQR